MQRLMLLPETHSNTESLLKFLPAWLSNLQKIGNIPALRRFKTAGKASFLRLSIALRPSTFHVTMRMPTESGVSYCREFL